MKIVILQKQRMKVRKERIAGQKRIKKNHPLLALFLVISSIKKKYQVLLKIMIIYQMIIAGQTQNPKNWR
jgi:hypothetical protein